MELERDGDNKEQAFNDRPLALNNKRSQLKVSQVVAGACCSRHLQCIDGGERSPYMESDSMSVDSEMLREIEPKDISTDPLFCYQNKPEIDMLGQINIKRKKYQQMMQQCENQQKQKLRKELIQKVKNDAKKALQASKKVEKSHKAKWGHTIFETKKEEKQEGENRECKQEKEKRKVALKPINQRIAEYKVEELKKMKSAENFRKPTRDNVDVEDCKEKIKGNAGKILQHMREQKQKALEDKRIVQAKIRALQIQSLKKVQNCKKKPLQNAQSFELGDSQYSTFEARAEGRKFEKKKKKGKQKPIQPSLLDTKKSRSSKNLKRPSTLRKDNEKTVPRNKQEQNRSKQQQQIVKQEIKGPFFIWNMPILPQDLQKLQKPSRDVFMNVDRFNYKQGKTFREEANQYLHQKMEKKMQFNSQLTKQQRFLVEVERKKQLLGQQFAQERNQAMRESFWNQDELFRPNVLQNFHFYPKEGVF